MLHWSLSTEVFSLFILFILLINFHERRWGGFPKRKLYCLCMYTSVGSILINILCTCLIALRTQVPLWVDLLCNSAYFLLIVAVCTIVAYYLCYLLYEHNYRRKGLKIYLGFLKAVYLLYVLLIIYNLTSGIVFFFDQERIYRRGPLVNAGYGVMFLELLGLILISIANRRSISRPMCKVMQTLPPIVVALTVYQLLYPEELINGAMIVTANIVLLVNFQSRQIEQDVLTLSGNRGSLHQELILRLGGRQSFQIVAISLQQYRGINQRYGLRRGDGLLCEIARWLEELHPKGKSFRTGNVEFVLLVPYEGTRKADEMVRMVTDRFQEPWMVSGVNITPQAVFAEFICTGVEESADDILELLNFSLSQAKSDKGHMLRFDPGIYEQMRQQSRIMNLMQKALREGLFETWYQPVYSCKTGKLTTAEALVRMRDEERNLISPGVFIPLAEENGLIEEITDVVIEQTCRLLADPAARELECVSINLSAQQFLSEDLIRGMDAMMEKYSFDPKRLRLEVTERVLLENAPKTRMVMEELSRRGFEFSLDDFGTGHSNLSLILEYSFSCIKLDRSLIREYPENERSASIVNAMVKLFQGMGCQITAEGVETQTQAKALEDRGVEWLQGFYYAKPMPVEEFLEMLSRETAGSERGSGIIG